MKHLARPPVKISNVTRGALNELGSDNQISCRDDNRALRNEKPSALNTIVDADVAAPGILRKSNVGHEILWHTDAIEQFPFSHSTIPLQSANDYQNTGPLNSTEDSWNDSRNRSCNAFGQIESKTPACIGATQAGARISGEGRHRYLKFLKNQSAKKYSIINTMIAPIAHHIESSFGFLPRRTRSSSQSPLIASPKAVSASLSILHSLPRANAGHRGCVASQ